MEIPGISSPAATTLLLLLRKCIPTEPISFHLPLPCHPPAISSQLTSMHTLLPFHSPPIPILRCTSSSSSIPLPTHSHSSSPPLPFQATLCPPISLHSRFVPLSSHFPQSSLPQIAGGGALPGTMNVLSASFLASLWPYSWS